MIYILILLVNILPLTGCNTWIRDIEGCASYDQDTISSATFQHYCYQFVKTRKTWHEASVYCEESGAILLSADDAVTNTHITAMINDAELWEGNGIWIGLCDVAVEGQFVWANGNKVLDSSWSNWGYMADSRVLHDSRDCVMMSKKRQWKWQTAQCQGKFSFICQYEKDRTFMWIMIIVAFLVVILIVATVLIIRLKRKRSYHVPFTNQISIHRFFSVTENSEPGTDNHPQQCPSEEDTECDDTLNSFTHDNIPNDPRTCSEVNSVHYSTEDVFLQSNPLYGS